MAGLSADRPSEVVLAARVARQFYIEGVSKIDIADRLGISRFRVARLLDSARETGMVRIEIGLPGGSLDAGHEFQNLDCVEGSQVMDIMGRCCLIFQPVESFV